MAQCDRNLKRGDAIPGSRFYRDFCECGEPLRVAEERVGSHLSCEVCSGKRNIVGTPRHIGDEDANGGWSNVARAFEEE